MTRRGVAARMSGRSRLVVALVLSLSAASCARPVTPDAFGGANAVIRVSDPVRLPDGSWQLGIHEGATCATTWYVSWRATVHGAEIEVTPRLVRNWFLTEWLYGEPRASVRISRLDNRPYDIVLTGPGGLRVPLTTVVPSKASDLSQARWQSVNPSRPHVVLPDDDGAGQRGGHR